MYRSPLNYLRETRILTLMHEISLELPYPPSLNNYYHANGYGGLYVSKEGKVYRKRVCGEIYKQTRNKIRINTEVSVVIDTYPPDRRRRDIDNILKCLLDALQDSGIIKNDNLISELTIRRNKETKGMVRVKINPFCYLPSECP